MSYKSTAIVVGCKKHEQIAKRFFDLANIYWPEIAQSSFFCTDEYSEFQNGFCHGSIVVETTNNYAERIKLGLSKIESDYVVLLLDDYYLTKTIDNVKFEELIDSLRENDIDYCKLVGLPRCHKRFKPIKQTYLVTQKTHYGISLQPSIWKKESLLKALELCTGTSAWEVEAAFSNYQKNSCSKCISFNKNYLSFKNGVLRGKLFPYTNKLLKKNNLEELDLPSISRSQYFKFSIRQHISSHIPSFVRKTGKKIGKKAGKKYYTED